MQPYFFPYLGYFQLVSSVEKFVFYDDVSYIKQGWINRNRINLNGEPWTFSIPIAKQSSFRQIRETKISNHLPWRERTLKTIMQAYRRSPYFMTVFPIIEEVFNGPADSIAELAKQSVLRVSKYLSLQTFFQDSSVAYNNQDLRAEERVIDICLKEKASRYVNLVGGQELYGRDHFSREGIDLCFLQMKPIHYLQQSTHPFIPGLSIIDVLMNNSKDQLKYLIQSYEIL